MFHDYSRLIRFVDQNLRSGYSDEGRLEGCQRRRDQRRPISIRPATRSRVKLPLCFLHSSQS